MNRQQLLEIANEVNNERIAAHRAKREQFAAHLSLELESRANQGKFTCLADVQGLYLEVMKCSILNDTIRDDVTNMIIDILECNDITGYKCSANVIEITW
jgi:hypothetical protein